MKCLPAMVMVLILSGCIVPEPAVRPAVFDFGHPVAPVSNGATAKPILVVADVQALRRFDSTYIYYRLGYANAQEPRPYANSRWVMPPAQLIQQRLKARLTQAFVVASPGDAVAAPVLKVELEVFDQEFATRESSQGVLRFRASLVHHRQLLAQREFEVGRPAPTADAAGGVRALTQATDDVLDTLVPWALAAVSEQR